MAGLDPSAGAGLYADIKTFSSLGVWCMGVPTSLTVQNNKKFVGVAPVSEDYFRKSIYNVFASNKVNGVKIGLLTEVYQVKIVAECIDKLRPAITVLDPIVSSSSGVTFWNEKLTACVVEKLLGKVDVITPNVSEAKHIMKSDAEGEKLAIEMNKRFRCKIALTGGDTNTDNTVQDIYYDGREIKKRTATFIDIPKHMKHGTGCAFSSALTANLVLGVDFMEACLNSAVYVENAIKSAIVYADNDGGLNHFWS